MVGLALIPFLLFDGIDDSLHSIKTRLGFLVYRGSVLQLIDVGGLREGIGGVSMHGNI